MNEFRKLVVRQHTEKLARDVAGILSDDDCDKPQELGKVFEELTDTIAKDFEEGDATAEHMAEIFSHFAFDAKGNGPAHQKLAISFDNLRRSGVRPRQAFAEAWKALSDAERQAIRNEEIAVLQAEIDQRPHDILKKDFPTMTRIESFELLAKSAGFGAVAAAICQNDGDPCISEKELSDLLKADCARRGISFADAYAADINIRKAFAITQQAGWAKKAKIEAGLAKLGPGDGWSTGGAYRARTEPRTLQSSDDDAVKREMFSAPWLTIEEATARVRAAREAAQRVADRYGRARNPQ